MNVVFLDIDGCLNSRAFYDRVGLIPHPWLDPEAIARLDRLCREADARIVLSSYWRGDPRTDGWLYERGLTRGIIVGQTPYCGATGNRGGEIAEWLVDTPLVVDRFVILDDGDDMDDLLPYLIQTDHATGLLDCHVERAVKMLRGEA